MVQGKSILKWGMISSGFFVLILISVLVLNTKVAKCIGEDNFSESENMCYYLSDTCNNDELFGTFNEQNACYYSKQGFLNQDLVVGLILFFVVLWFIVGIIFLILLFKRDEPMKKIVNITPNQAMDTWALWFSERLGNLPIMDNDKYDKNAFNFYGGGAPTQKGRELFYKFSVEVKKGSYVGVFTIATTLSRGVEWILGGGATWRETFYGNFRIPKDWAIYTPEDPQERALQLLAERSPERAAEIQQQMIEKEASDMREDSVHPEQIQGVQGEDSEQPRVVVVKQQQRRYAPYGMKRPYRRMY